jgi:hypothetical protein
MLAIFFPKNNSFLKYSNPKLKLWKIISNTQRAACTGEWIKQNQAQCIKID